MTWTFCESAPANGEVGALRGWKTATATAAAAASDVAAHQPIRRRRRRRACARTMTSSASASSSSITSTSATLGGTLHVRRGTPVELVISIDLANGPNWAQFVPVLSRVDVIEGDVTGPVRDRDAFTAPRTRVVKSFDVNKSAGTVAFTYPLGRLDRPVYVRLRGTDGNRVAPGFHGAAADPNGAGC